jgi:hypothetical protein
MKLSSAVGLAACGTVFVASVAAAQQPIPPPSPAKKLVVEITLQAGGDSYRFSGPAECGHEPKGYIYMLPAQLWRVDHTDGARGVSLTFWRPANGSHDMFTIYVKSGGKTYEASTVKTDHGGSLKGSGEVTFASASAGGAFTVNVTAANGAKVSGTIKCNGFGAIVAEGGN